MEIQYICRSCGKGYNIKSSMAFRCDCGGLFDLDGFKPVFSRDDILQGEMGLFRYHKALPFGEGSEVWRDITMGEGYTPILPLGREWPNLLMKIDYMMPTLSFKDRGAAVLIAKAKELGVKKVLEDSSGNAGASIAAYAARAGMDCDIYVPEGTRRKKIIQIAAYGATVHVVGSTREETAQAALQAASQGNAFYASHVYNPFFYQGTKTYIYEVWEQLSGSMPDVLIVPAGNGTLVLGIYYGLLDLKRSKLIDKLPRMIAVQALACSPLYRSFSTGKQTVEADPCPQETIAEGIAIANPMRGEQILQAIWATGGEIISVTDVNIQQAQKLLSQKGFYVEPTSAASLAGYLEHFGSTDMGRVLIPLCGAGTKT